MQRRAQWRGGKTSASKSGGLKGACDVNTSIISVKENVPAGTVIMRLQRESGEHWSFREDGPKGYIELNATEDAVIFYFTKTPDLEKLSTEKSSMHVSLPFTLECSFDGWKHVFKQSIVLMDINDNDPVFHPDRATTITVNENTSPGTTIIQLDGYAIDPDVSGYITSYEIAPHEDIENDGFDFFTVAGTGKELVVRRQLDFDQMRLNGRSFFLLNLTAMDNGHPEQRKAFTTLQVNVSDSDDQGPAFVYADCPLIDGHCTTPLYETVAQKSFTGELRVWPGPIKAEDKDSMNNTILYYVVKVSPDKYSAYFKMDAVTGKIRVIKAFGNKEIDAIHVTIKAEENSMTRRFLTTTLRVQVVGDYYANYKDSFRNVPVNEAVDGEGSSSSAAATGSTVPVSLFVATVAVFFIIVVSFPFIMVRVIKGKLMSDPTGVTSLQLNSSNSSSSSRKESSDTTTMSILTCTSNDTGSTIYGPRRDKDSDTSSTSSAESSDSASTSTSSRSSSVHLDFDDAISFATPSANAPDRMVSSVSFDPEEVSSRFSPPVPTKKDVSAGERFKRRLSRLINFHKGNNKDKQKSRVRFDIRNVSNFS
ncbi:protocadherin gamma-B7-like [Littorina saxatilis]|uniref:protocadherin gamma-B7-like n=1 Tax=Littorina saxatilis TaxID=31220 RepID=UPI0038B4CBD8